MSCLKPCVWGGEGTYAETNCTHHSHSFHLISQSRWDHILVDGIESEGTLAVVPPQSEIQDGNIICGGEQDIIIDLQFSLKIGANESLLRVTC